MVEESLESPLMGREVCGGRGLLLKQKPYAVEFESCFFFFFLIIEEHLGKPKISKQQQQQKNTFSWLRKWA